MDIQDNTFSLAGGGTAQELFTRGENFRPESMNIQQALDALSSTWIIVHDRHNLRRRHLVSRLAMQRCIAGYQSIQASCRHPGILLFGAIYVAGRIKMFAITSRL